MLVKLCCILFYRLWGNGYKSVKVYLAEYLRSVYFTTYLCVYLHTVKYTLGFSGGSVGEESSKECNTEDVDLIPGLGRSPGEGNGNPLQSFLAGESHGERSLVGYSPWGYKS